VKPSNVLLTADGVPMLLDFHLAREPIQPEGAVPTWLGGTPAYVSPEQRAVLAAVRSGKPIPAAVDGRSDVYSLILPLLELATGSASEFAEKPLPARPPDPSLPVAFYDLLRKCLARDPAERYASAADLASDLRRQMADMPLRGVRNRSWRERWQKGRRRRSHSLTYLGLVATTAVALIAATSLFVLQFNPRRDVARNALEVGGCQAQNHQYEDALVTLRRGRELAAGLPGAGILAAELDERIRQTAQAQIIEQLHRVADRVRFLCGTDLPSGKRMHDLEAQCWDLLQRQDEILTRLSRDDSTEAKQQIQADLLDLVILWSELHVHGVSPQEAPARGQEALLVLEKAQARFGASPVLLLQCKVCPEAAGLKDIAQAAEQSARQTPARTAWEHSALGRSLLHAGALHEAATHFDRAIELRPQEFLAHYYKGPCAYRLNRFQQAVLGFSGCIILSPEAAEPYFNRALALTAMDRTDEVLRDYDRALQLDSTLGPAALNRGLLHFREKHPEQAIRDLQAALHLGEDAATVHFNLALVYQSQKERNAALEHLEAALQANPRHREARQLLEKLRQQP
jgi:tetratricopeptide (TPR) repeat protein